MHKYKKEAVKSILGYQGMYNIKFLTAWTLTDNFKIWLKECDKTICNLSPQSGFVRS